MISKPPGTGELKQTFWEQLGTSGKNLKGSGKVCKWLIQLADRSYVVRMILVLEKIFKHFVSSMPLLVSLLIVQLFLNSSSKQNMKLILVLSPRKPLQRMRGDLSFLFTFLQI
jgi:hypothetical protein